MSHEQAPINHDEVREVIKVPISYETNGEQLVSVEQGLADVALKSVTDIEYSDEVGGGGAVIDADRNRIIDFPGEAEDGEA